MWFRSQRCWPDVSTKHPAGSQTGFSLALTKQKFFGVLVCDKLTPASATDYSTDDWRRCSRSRKIRAWSGHLRWRWLDHAYTCPTNGVAVLCSPSKTETDPSFGATGHIPVTGGNMVMTRLDYGNVVLVGLLVPAYLVQRLQSVLNAVLNAAVRWSFTCDLCTGTGEFIFQQNSLLE